MIDYSFLNETEKRLVTEGYDSFGIQERNNLISIIANKEGLMYSDITREYILDYHKALKKEILSDACDKSIVKGFNSNGHTYRANRDDQLNFGIKCAQIALDESIDTVQWKTEDAGYIEHTREEWIKVFRDGVAHKEGFLFKYNLLKEQVKNATTDAEVFAIAWE